MPHLVLTGPVGLEDLSSLVEGEVHRWRRAVLKTECCWIRGDERAALVEGVVVEFSRPLHPVAVVAARGGDTTVRLWSRVTVERTEAVQRWLCVIAVGLQRIGAGPVQTTNIPEEIWGDLDLQVVCNTTSGS
jgi:hypothetical protein